MILTTELTQANVEDACRDWFLARFKPGSGLTPPSKIDLHVEFCVHENSDYARLESAKVSFSFTIESGEESTGG